ncbi:MAG TPA: polyprenyl diphosphate synthase [Spirochaetota bacterium]|jgi:undecaprenyl diphosphate synthase|nr:polyprenyl diphosphate synthase [Spirochaetota bacterium]
MNNDLSALNMKNIPAHIAVIMDGNGRWAKKRGLDRSAGHKAGADVIEALMDAAFSLKIKCVSLYAFSTENWSRPSSEISSLWKLFEYYFDVKMPLMNQKGIKIVHSGVYDRLPKSMVEKIKNAEMKTAKNKNITLNFCLNYGSRREIVDAANRALFKTGKNVLTEKMITDNLYAPNLPQVDLMIRTSGEMRISNFLLWQAAYAELVFTKTLWPDFRPKHLYKAILEYQKRNRRFGGI